MNVWARIQFAIAAAGTAGFAAVGAHGYRVAEDLGLYGLHMQLGLVATLALVFAQAWMVLFAVGSERRLRALLAAGDAARAGVARVRTRVSIAGGVALAAALAHFVVAGRLFASHSPAWIHASSAAVALAAQCAALAVEARELGRHGRLVAGLAEAPAAPARVLDSARS